ncbi:MAG: hypothetical protein GKR89_03190 [Candidatus Latescibacteria bacterium]|nr:hypothetical protein [Candidatus Latescibacterota bacterium]
MSALHAPILSHDELQTYRDQGYVRLGKVVAPETIQALCQRIDDIMLGTISYEHMLMQLCPSANMPDQGRQSREFKGSTLKYRKIQDLEQDPLFRAYIQQALFRDLTAKIIGPEISVFRAMFFNKPAEQGVVINWHQDGAGGWGLSIPPKITVWTALDDTNIANGCLQIIPGSHKSLLPKTGDLLDEEERARYAPDSKRLYLEMEAGEVVLLHNWTLHRSETNHTNKPRRAFSVCYIDAATRQKNTDRDFPRVFPQYLPAQEDIIAAAS